MARFQHLPLYQASYGLCLNAHRLKLKMPKDLKHDAGAAFVNNCLKCLKIIVIANQLQEKKKDLDMLHFEFEMLWVSSRLLQDIMISTSLPKIKVTTKNYCGFPTCGAIPKLCYSVYRDVSISSVAAFGSVFLAFN